MIPGTPEAARWVQAEPRRAIPPLLIERMVHAAFPQRRVLEVQALGDGQRNVNLKLRLDGAPELAVLRVYEHDPSLCQKEIDLMCLVGGSVPVPEVLYAEPGESEAGGPIAILRFVEGINLRELKRRSEPQAFAQAARSAGETLAAIGRITFQKSGWLAPGPTVTAPLLEGDHALPRFVDLCLESPKLQWRMDAGLRDRVRAVMWASAARLDSLEGQRHLVHCDFGSRNLLVREMAGRWSVAAVLDWEFAVSGSPLIDVGHFLRYERSQRRLLEPHFSQGFLAAGGQLPDDWRHLARVFDLSALCEALTHDRLSEEVVVELIELVRAAVEELDPPRKNHRC
jgi:aminoglycoside phosphotransferase (APT) family kinase protein